MERERLPGAAGRGEGRLLALPGWVSSSAEERGCGQPWGPAPTFCWLLPVLWLPRFHRARVRKTLIVITINNNNDVPSPHPPCRVAALRPGRRDARRDRHGSAAVATATARGGAAGEDPASSRSGSGRPGPHTCSRPAGLSAERRPRGPLRAAAGPQRVVGGSAAQVDRELWAPAASLSVCQPGAQLLGFRPAGLHLDNGVC